MMKIPQKKDAADTSSATFSSCHKKIKTSLEADDTAMSPETRQPIDKHTPPSYDWRCLPALNECKQGSNAKAAIEHCHASRERVCPLILVTA
jgi:hypothetical protein